MMCERTLQRVRTRLIRGMYDDEAFVDAALGDAVLDAILKDIRRGRHARAAARQPSDASRPRR